MRKRFSQHRQMCGGVKKKMHMLRNLVTSLIDHERVVTTYAKAKEVQGMAEKLVTMAKKENKLHARRLVNQIVHTREAQMKVMGVLGPRYEFREGGYTRVMKLAMPRKGDGADMAVIEYVDRPGEIRAARPPSFFQNKTIEEVMKELGIEDPVKKTTTVQTEE